MVACVVAAAAHVGFSSFAATNTYYTRAAVAPLLNKADPWTA
jgi:hypothetical protein